MGALAVAAFTLAPALSAQENRLAPRVALSKNSGIGSFTPASADPKLAAMLERNGASSQLTGPGFGFTPSESTRRNARDITVAVRTRSTGVLANVERIVASNDAVSLAPISYNLGVSVGWKRFAVASDVAKADAAAGNSAMIDVGSGYAGLRAPTRPAPGTSRPIVDAPQLVRADPNYSIDTGKSLSLTGNLDVTAGIRAKSEKDRLPRFADDRRDSQAVYVGTAFRF